MTDYKRTEVTTTRVQFHVDAPFPDGANWSDVMNMIRLVHQELWSAGIVTQDRDAPDNVVRLMADDNEIIVSYEKRVINGHPQGQRVEAR